jgi:hypothetical protein
LVKLGAAWTDARIDPLLLLPFGEHDGEALDDDG